MKRMIILFYIVCVGVISISMAAGQGPRLTWNPEYGNVPLYFVPNKGQVDKNVIYYAKTSNYVLWLTREGLVFDSVRRGTRSQRSLSDGSFHAEKIERDVSRLIFLNANKTPAIVPLNITEYKVNYFIGKEPEKWKKGISTAQAVLYKEIYRNIDLKVYGNEKHIEYDWIVKPGGNPQSIRFKYGDVKDTQIDCRGNLLIKMNYGELRQNNPVSYQEINGEKVRVVSNYKRVDKNSYGFEVHPFSKEHDLIIDPVVTVEYSTYLGGNNDELYSRQAVDDLGYVYLTGYTYSYDFPVRNAYQGSKAGMALDAILTKLDPSGSSLIFSTYFGGSSSEYFFGIDVAENGDIYIAGDTFSSDLPAINSRIGGKDIFIARFDSHGNFLAGRYLGGDSEDRNLDIVVDDSDYLWVTGFTHSTHFPLKNPYQSWISGNRCAYITKLTSDLTTIEYSTFLGGGGEDIANGIKVDKAGYFYVFGRTGSRDFPLRKAWQNKYSGGVYDTFLSKFVPDGSSLEFSTYLGGSGNEYSHDICLGNSGSIVVGGFTDSIDFPTKNPYQENNAGSQDVFISIFNSDGSKLLYSTYLGGIAEDQHGALVMDRFGYIYVSGTTYSSNFPVKFPYQSSKKGECDAFLSILSPEGVSSGPDLIYSTFWGGSGWERCLNIDRDGSGNICIAGETASMDFPVSNSFQPSLGGGRDFFVTRFSFGWNLTVKSSPDNGVPISVSFAGTNGNSEENTDFTRTVSHGESVILTAPASHNQKVFYKWAIDGVENFDRTIHLTMERDHEVIVLYGNPPDIHLSRTQLYFGACSGGATTGAQNFFIDISNGLPQDLTVDDNAAWMDSDLTIDSDFGEVRVTVNSQGLAAGIYSGVVSVSSPLAGNTPQPVAVTLSVYHAGDTKKPFGYFDTPREGATVASSIPVTGWILDDIEVLSVKIYRQQGNDMIFIGNAVFVDGARPDVELAYPDYPKSYRAGWGYMMLTNFLPNGGNGPVTLHVIATDKEGNQVTFGQKNIVCDNANAVRPFGAIDTPASGGVASGSNYRNQGWVLTPVPKKIPEDGHSIIVWIDGFNMGNPIYNVYRPDIARLFPGYANSNGAMAYFDFDTTLFKNGMHTIQWTALDNAGKVDGIGCRYFTIKNSGGSFQCKSDFFSEHRSVLNSYPSRIPLGYSNPIRVKKGYNRNIKPYNRFPDEKGNTTVLIEELEPVEIDLGIAVRLRGFLLVGNQLRKLPVGSFLNSEKGIFRWQPGPGFVGKYRLVFLEDKNNGTSREKIVTIHILPKFK